MKEFNEDEELELQKFIQECIGNMNEELFNERDMTYSHEFDNQIDTKMSKRDSNFRPAFVLNVDSEFYR